MKEKIGMEKLVMLLDIYEEEVVGVHSVGEHITEKDEAWIISKKFGFIKWLVENDKIDLWSNTFTEKEERYFGEQPDFTFQSVKYTHLLMILSISDTPIDFLCDIIKN